MSTEPRALPEFERLEFNCENQVFHSDGYNAPPSAPKLDGDNRWSLIVVCAPATVLRLFRTRMEGGAARVGLLDYDSLRADFATFVQGNNWPSTPEGWAEWPWYQSILATADLMTSANEPALDEFRMLLYDGVTRRFDLKRCPVDMSDAIYNHDKCYINDWYVVLNCAPKVLIDAFVGNYLFHDWPTTVQLRARFARYLNMSIAGLPTMPEAWRALPSYQALIAAYSETDGAAVGEVFNQSFDGGIESILNPSSAPDPAERYHSHIRLTDEEGQSMYLPGRNIAVMSVNRGNCQSATAIYVSTGPVLYCRESVDEVMAMLYPERYSDEDEEPIRPRLTHLTFSEAADYMRQGYYVTHNGASMRFFNVQIQLTIAMEGDREVLMATTNSARQLTTPWTTLKVEDILTDTWYVIDPSNP